MKKLFILTAIIATSFIATKGYAQVFVGARIGPAHIGVGLPVVPHPYVVAAPVVYGDFPGYAYYNYPAWNGHFRDRNYYEHYRPVFMRSHPYYHRGR
jgi:hypothetical protein